MGLDTYQGLIDKVVPSGNILSPMVMPPLGATRGSPTGGGEISLLSQRGTAVGLGEPTRYRSIYAQRLLDAGLKIQQTLGIGE